MKLNIRSIVWLLLGGFFLLFFCLPMSWGEEEYKRGTISSDETWEVREIVGEGSTTIYDTYVVLGDIHIAEGVKLTIKEGVTVKFRAVPVAGFGYSIQVNGTLDAQGTSGKPVTFTREDSENNWGAIFFNFTSKDSILDNCIIEYGGNNIIDNDLATVAETEALLIGEAVDTSGIDKINAAVLCWEASPVIQNCTIRNSQNIGINIIGKFTDPGQPKIENNNIYYNPYGVYIRYDGAIIKNNYFYANNLAVYFEKNYAAIEISNNTIISLSGLSGNCIYGEFYYPVDISKSETEKENEKKTVKIQSNTLDSLTDSLGSIILGEYSFVEQGEEVRAYYQPNYNLEVSGNNFNTVENGMIISLGNFETKTQFSMPNNWWGVESLDASDPIFDKDNYNQLPEVLYEPLAITKNTDAGSSLSFPVQPVASTSILAIIDEEEYVVPFGNEVFYLAGDYQAKLIGNGSYNLYPENDKLTYKWEQISGKTVTLSTPYEKDESGEVTENLDLTAATFIVPYVAGEAYSEEENTLVFRLTVTNETTGLSDSEDLTAVVLEDTYSATRDEGACFVSVTGMPSGVVSVQNHFPKNISGRIIPFVLMMGFILLFVITFASYKNKNFFLSFLFVFILTVSTDSARAGYFTIGGGDGGDADATNITIESGATRLGGGDVVTFSAGLGLFGILHGHDNIPSDTREFDIPHTEYIEIDAENEGVETGLYFKAGIGFFDSILYFSILGGVSRATETELYQSTATGFYFEKDSDQVFYGVYGGGVGLFLDMFNNELCFQVDYDNRRGVTGSIGFYW